LYFCILTIISNLQKRFKNVYFPLSKTYSIIYILLLFLSPSFSPCLSPPLIFPPTLVKLFKIAQYEHLWTKELSYLTSIYQNNYEIARNNWHYPVQLRRRKQETQKPLHPKQFSNAVMHILPFPLFSVIYLFITLHGSWFSLSS
jgi:hypothetical protein